MLVQVSHDAASQVLTLGGVDLELACDEMLVFQWQRLPPRVFDQGTGKGKKRAKAAST